MDDVGFSDPVRQAQLDAKEYRHPKAVFFHLFFRSAAIVTYIVCELFSSSFVLNFIVVVLLLAFDFWTIKNVTGRLVVGLRWWNHISEDGESKWIFESKKNFSPHPTEARIFWWTLYLYSVVWVLLSLVSVLKLNLTYLLIDAVALALNVSNVVGYTKCDKDAKKKLTGLASDYSRSLLMSVVSSAFSSSTATAAT